jgi:tetratricopeptide (TPR) repeat protein
MRRMATTGMILFLMLGLAWPADAQRRRKKKGGDDMSFQPEEIKRSAPESKIMKRALRFYENGDYYSASIFFHKVLKGETGDSEVTKEKATFWMGKTLYHLRFYSSALTYFDKLVDKGHSRTLIWLASLSRKLPESTGILEKIGRYDEKNPNALQAPELEPVRVQLFYLLGRFYYNRGDKTSLEKALKLFDKVTEQSKYYPRAKLFEGITYVRLRNPVQASRSFKGILRYARTRKKKLGSAQFDELARLSLARVFYQAGGVALRLAWQMRSQPFLKTALKQFQLAIKYYETIPISSLSWLQSLFEESWAFFMLDAEIRKIFLKDYQGFQKALGNIHTINAPFFENYFFMGLPESLILRAVIYYKNCRWARARETLREFNTVYPPMLKRLFAVVKKHPDDNDYFDFAKKMMAGKAALDLTLTRITRSVLTDRTLLKRFQYVDELDRELRQVENAEPAWKSTAIAGSILQDLSLQKSLAIGNAGKLARARLKRLSEEISRLVGKATDIEFEILEGEKGRLEAKARRAVIRAKVIIQKPKVDDEHVVWPFRGAYWKDELGYYRFVVRNTCPKK